MAWVTSGSCVVDRSAAAVPSVRNPSNAVSCRRSKRASRSPTNRAIGAYSSASSAIRSGRGRTTSRRRAGGRGAGAARGGGGGGGGGWGEPVPFHPVEQPGERARGHPEQPGELGRGVA